MTSNPKKSGKPDYGKGPSKLAQFLLAILVLAAGAGAALMLIKSKKPPKTVEKPIMAPLVETTRINQQDVPITIRAFGTAQPKVKVGIVPQVAGNLVYVNPAFRAGGFIKANQPIVRIDQRDYELAVEQAQAIVADAEVKRDLEQAEAGVALEQWKQLNPNKTPASTLVTRGPQMKQANAALKSAQAKLESAQLNLERTKVSLPIDTVILTAGVDLGQFVGVGQSIGSAYGIESVEVEVPLEDHELEWFDVPEGPPASNVKLTTMPKTAATIKADFAGAEHTWKGYVTRTTGQIDTVSRMVSVVVEVPEPFSKIDNRPPLMPGMFVEVRIKGKTLRKALRIPRKAVHNRNQLWVVRDNHLYIKTLDIVRTDRDFVYVVSGIKDKTVIVTSALDTATNGMKIRTEKDEPKQPDPTATQPDNNNG